MHTTPISLIQRLRQPKQQATDWDRFFHLYTPLLYRWGCRKGLQEQDAMDLVQEVFVVLVRVLPEFQYDEGRSFRGWLREVTMNKWRDFLRRRGTRPRGNDDGVPDLAAPDGECFEETEYRREVVGRALEVIRSDFEGVTWKAFHQYVVGGRPAAAVAAELGISDNAVYLARGRILKRLREELDGLLDPER